MQSFFRWIQQLNRKKESPFDPEAIFLDASNLPEFDTTQFEGRIEQPIGKRTFGFLALVFIIIGVLFVGRLWDLQVTGGESYAQQSKENRLSHSLLFAERGVIYDRNGEELVWNIPNADEQYAKRVYIDEVGFGHILGYIQAPQEDNKGIFFRTETNGLAGVEKAYNELLQGKNGLKIVETDARSEIKSESTVEPAEDGENLTLTIDAKLQSAFHTYIEKVANEQSYLGGAGIIMNIENGELIALASYPEYSSEVLSEGNDNNLIASYIFDEQKPFLNRATSGLYPPGSIIKPFFALAALEEKLIDPNKEIYSSGSIRVENPYVPGQYTVFPDWKAHGYVNLQDALSVSSNVYFFYIGGGFEEQEGLGIERIEQYARSFGIGEVTGAKFAEEQAGVIPNPKWKEEVFGEEWRLGDTYNTSIGQYGFQVTPLQMVRAMAALINNGTLFTPKLVKENTSEIKTLNLDPKNIEVVKAGMVQAVEEGTAKGLNVPYVSVAAKTGSAQAGGSNEFINSWSIGYFPAEQPKYAFIALMERGPSTNTIGGVFVMRQLLDWMNANVPEYFSM